MEKVDILKKELYESLSTEQKKLFLDWFVELLKVLGADWYRPWELTIKKKQ